MQSDNIHKAVVAVAILFCLSPLLDAQQSDVSKSFLDKARKVKATAPAARNENPSLPAANQEENYGNAVSSSTLSLIRPPKDEQPEQIIPQGEVAPQSGKEEIVNTDKPDASASIKTPQFKKVKKTAPKKAPEPGHGIKWIDSSTRNFSIKVEPQTSGIMTPNLGMKFETVYQVLSKNISWMMSGKAKVYVYQNRQSFLRNEPVASSWSGAFFSPTEDRIVMYDEPKNTSKMLSQFTHELTHLFVEEFYNPPSESYKLEPPIWLNEGLAVNMEDISSSTKGGVWANDLVVINIISQSEKLKLLSRLRSGQRLTAEERRAAASNMVTAKTVVFTNFADFVKNSSYDIAEQKGDVENWYFQAYAMVRFLFRSKNSDYPDKRIQFEQFTKLMKTFEDKKDSKGNVMRDEHGRVIKKRMSTEAALKKAYGFRNMQDFEAKFWKWLVEMQRQERQKIKNGQF